MIITIISGRDHRFLQLQEMKRYQYTQNKTVHAIAISVAVLLHLALFFWLSQPTKPKIIRQSISVSMVAPTTILKKQEVEVKKPKQDFIKSRSKEKTKNLVKKSSRQKEGKKRVIEKVEDRNFETSGEVSETATAQKSALVEPVYNATYLKNPSPSYPSRAKRRRMEGEVLLKVSVSTLGKALSVEVEKSSGYKILDKAAMKAVKKWRFVPAYLGNKVVEATVLVPIEFKLE